MTLYCAESFTALNPDVPLLCTRDIDHVGPHATTVGETVYSGPERDGQQWPADFGADCKDAGRHPKWQRVEPGTVIPAGQPYRVEYGEYGTPGWNFHEFSSLNDFPRPGLGDDAGKVFVDSSWKPPLVLPTEPTWGILLRRDRPPSMSRWHFFGPEDTTGWLDFIPLTDEQVARIEAAR